MNTESYWNRTPSSSSYRGAWGAEKCINGMIRDFGPFYTEAFIRAVVSEESSWQIAGKFNVHILTVNDLKKNLEVAVRFMLRLSSYLRGVKSSLGPALISRPQSQSRPPHPFQAA